MEKKNFVEPTFDLIVLDTTDVVTSSGEYVNEKGDFVKFDGLFDDEEE